MPSMAEAAKIRDVVARHNYVFDNGLCSPDFFDVEKRRSSEEYGLLEGTHLDSSILELGCFTGLNLLCLEQDGYCDLTGVDYVAGAIAWMLNNAHGHIKGIVGSHMTMRYEGPWDRVICFDVLEHQLSMHSFLHLSRIFLHADGQALFLVPQGKEYHDCGHVAWFPDEECLTNVLDYYFDVIETRRLDCKKLFARCRKRGND